MVDSISGDPAALAAAASATEVALSPAAAARIADLEGQIKTLIAEMDCHEEEQADLQTALDQRTAERDTAVAGRHELEGQIVILTGDAEASLDAMTHERNVAVLEAGLLAKERDALKAAADKLAAAPTAAPVEAPKRKIAAMDNPPTAELLAMIRAAGGVQLAFSNGKTDVAHLRPMMIGGDAWRVAVNGLALQMPNFLITNGGGVQVELAGYALFIDGKQIAWAPRSDVLVMWPGQTMNLSSDVIFSG